MSEPVFEQVGTAPEEATVRYELHENKLSVSFFAVEVIGSTVPEGKFLYNRREDLGPGDTEEFSEAERFVEGFVKWDGCSHYYFGDGDDGYLHLCGPGPVKFLGEVVGTIFQRCGEIMKAVGTELLAGEFPE